MYKKKLHREEQINKNYLPIFEEKNKSTKIFTSNKTVDACMVFYIIEQQIIFLDEKFVQQNCRL